MEEDEQVLEQLRCSWTTSLPLVLQASRLIKHETWKIGGLEESSVFVSSIDIYASTLDDESDGSSMEGQEIDT